MSEDIGIAIAGIEIVRRVVIGDKEDITFRTGIDQTTDGDDLNRILDLIGAAATRQKAIAELPMKEQALEIARIQPKKLDDHIAEQQKQRAQFVAAMQAAHSANRRGEFKMTESQRRGLEEFDRKLEQAQMSRGSFARDIAICEWEIARRKAIIAGEPEPPKPSEVTDAISDLMLSAAE